MKISAVENPDVLAQVTASLYRTGVRESYRDRLPRWLQGKRAQEVITWFTGKPLANQCVRKAGTPVAELSRDVGVLGLATAGAAASVCLLGAGGFAMLPLLWLIQVGRLRKLQVAHGHEASHGNFFGAAFAPTHRRWLNEWVLDIATTIPVVQNGADYRPEHRVHHEEATFTSSVDADNALLMWLGFRKSMSVPELWRHLATVVSSPKFHGSLLLGRLRSNLIAARGRRRAMGVAWLGMLGASAFALPFHVWFLVVFLPWGPLYNASALLQFLSEHGWRLDDPRPVGSRQAYAERCWARFCGAPLPDRSLTGWAGAAAWLAWAFRMLFVEVPVRLAVLPRCLMVHDYHHLSRWGGDRLEDWPNAIYRRERAIQSGDPMGLAKRELWGLKDSIEHTFGVMSGAKS